MKNFNLQSLTLVVMTVLVCSASLMSSHKTRKEQLRLIREEAQNMYNQTHWNELVPRVPGNKTCVNHFLCLAEKSLNSTTDLRNSKLVRLISRYNKMANDTNCDVKLNSRYHVKRLLEAISRCAKF